MSTEAIIEVERDSALAAFEKEGGLDFVVQAAQSRVREFEHDMSTATNRKKTASLAAKVARLKTSMDAMGKELVSEWKEKSKKVDGNRKALRDALDELKAEARKPLDEWEAEESKKAEELEKKLDRLRVNPNNLGNLEHMKNELEGIRSIEIDDSFDPRKQDAKDEQKRSIEYLEEAIAKEEVIEAQRQENERLKAEAEAKAKAEEEERLRREGEERARILADEKAKKEAEEAKRREFKLQREKEEAEEARKKAELEVAEANKRAAGEVTRRVEEKECLILEEKQRRAANKEHVQTVAFEARDAIMSLGIDKETAQNVIRAIKDGKIPHVQINF